MYEISAEYYDVVYSSKNYEREAHVVRRLIAERRPGAQALLDLACGTGAHDLHLSRYYEIDGLDLNPGFLVKARERNGRGHYREADMCDFALDRMYDAVICLFSSIGYMQTLDNVRKTLVCCREHLAEGGLVFIEPWFTPDQWQPGVVHVLNAERDGIAISRMGFSAVRGAVSLNPCQYLVGTTRGIEHYEETHEMGLFTVEEMHGAFAAAGLDVEYDPEGLIGRGLYIGRKKE
ncbi:MAG: class I SAM-dependent methyltransferase [Candidatus Latescibacterota bacterium]|nr:class I SAM-dependent methyltransferase [Candidatus Latescibacterota bacterium]